MTNDTATPEGREKRKEELVTGHIKTGNKKAIIRMVGGSVEDWDEKYEHSYGASHPDQI